MFSIEMLCALMKFEGVTDKKYVYDQKKEKFVNFDEDTLLLGRNSPGTLVKNTSAISQTPNGGPAIICFSGLLSGS